MRRRISGRSPLRVGSPRAGPAAARGRMLERGPRGRYRRGWPENDAHRLRDRKSTRLNSSHSQISYAVFCLKKKKSNAMIIDNPKGKADQTTLRQLPAVA